MTPPHILIGDAEVGLKRIHRRTLQGAIAFMKKKTKRGETDKMAHQVLQVIATSENIKRVTDVPQFYVKAKDTITVLNFIDRVEEATTIGNWNKKRHCTEFCHLLQAQAGAFVSNWNIQTIPEGTNTKLFSGIL